MRVIALIVCSTIVLMGCTSAPLATFTPSGAPGYRIYCGGFFGDGDLGSCYSKAGEICKQLGYKISQTGVNSLIIECKDS